MVAANPIAERLTRLRTQWCAFAEDQRARALHWLIADDEWRMLDTFFTLESLPSADTDDVFLRVDLPFDAAARYGLDVRAWIVREYDVAAPQLAASGVVTGWRAPAATADDVASLCAALGSLWRHHQPMVRHLVVVLEPRAVRDASAWIGWLGRLVAALPDAGVRVILVDRSDTAALAPIAVQQASRVRTVVAGLDMPTAYVELSAQAPGGDAPPGQFRQAFVEMSAALARDDMALARDRAARADAIAQANGWAHLQFAVAFAMASGSLGAGDHAGAIRGYRDAERHAVTAHARGESFGLGLRLDAVLAQGACCIAAGAFALGAERYDAAAALADALEDTRMRLESRRMASYCYEHAGNGIRAWALGIAALGVAEQLDADARRTSTLPALGVAMLRLAATPRHAGLAPVIEARMVALLGPSWRELDVQDAA